MNTTHNRKKLVASALGAAAAAVAAPALLLMGAGTAQANTNITVTPNAAGTNVHVVNMSLNAGWCTYTAVPQNSPLLPYTSLPFHLDGWGSVSNPFDVQTLGIPTGTQWIPNVSCDNGGPQVTFWQNQPKPITY